MSSNDLYSFTFDSNNTITAVYEVHNNGTLENEGIDSDETYTLLDGYVVKTEIEHGQTEYEIYEEDSTTGYWREVASGYGTVDSSTLAALVAAGSTSTHSSDDHSDDDSDHDGSDDDGLSGDLYSFVLDSTGTTVTAVYEVEDNGTLEQETIDANESYTVSGDYIVEVETYSYGVEWSVYQLDATTGYYVEVAEGEGTPDLTDIDALVASYVPGSYTRYSDNDSYDGSDDRDDHDGNDDDNHLLGNGGNDRLKGNGGHDNMDGGRGKDKLFGGAGDDTISGGDGRDMIKGGAGDDSLSGGAGNDRLFGNGGNDTLEGGAGKDKLKGGAGNDVLDGGIGNDRLWGDAGDDTLTGGAGEDRFIFKSGAGADTITDFEIGVDLLVIDTDIEAAFADLTVTDSGADAVVSYSGGTITLTDVDAALLTADNFVFG